MSENTTRIVDLPDNNNYQSDNGYANQPMNHNHNRTQNNIHISNNEIEQGNTTYVPMNIHPNPYGNNIQPDMMPPPEFQTSQMRNDFIAPEQQTVLQNTPQMRLPSRDIPMNQAAYQQDEEIQPNFIPKPKLTSDYVKEYEDASEKAIRKQEKKKYQDEKIDQTLTDFQIPILIAFLFFIFQLPIINSTLFKYLSFLPLFNKDGNVNLYGILLKSSLFGSTFLIIQKFINFLLVL